MTSKKHFEHPKWGLIKISVNSRARRITMRAREDAIYMTIPQFATKMDVDRALSLYGDDLKKQQLSTKKVVDQNYSVGNGDFRIDVQEYKGVDFMLVHNGAMLTLMCPEKTDYEKKQNWLRRVIINIVTTEAKRVLPARLEMLSKIHNLKYNRCTVRNSHTCWGSCSGKGNISLSIYLVLLPAELVDYVILHELCHTMEMNHSERFWEKLDKLCNANSKEIRGKLKKYSPGI